LVSSGGVVAGTKRGPARFVNYKNACPDGRRARLALDLGSERPNGQIAQDDGRREAPFAHLPAVANQRGCASPRAALARGHDIC